MTTKTSEKAFLVLSIMFILISGNITLISAQQENANLILRITISPSNIEQTENTHKIGYVWLENRAGNPISLPRETVINLESDKPEIASVVDSVTIPANSQYNTFEITTPTFRIIQGIENITSQIERVLENNTGVFYLITTLEDVSKLYHTTIPEKVKQTERNGGTVRLVVDEIPDKMRLFIKRFGASEVRIGKLPSKGRIAVSKSCPISGKLLMSDSAVKGNLHENTDAECALFTNSDEMTNNIFTLCTFIWKGSVPVEL